MLKVLMVLSFVSLSYEAHSLELKKNTRSIFIEENPALSSFLMESLHVDFILLALWPSWIFFVADPGGQSLAIAVLSIATNAILYGVIGIAAWLGFHRNKAILVVVGAAIAAAWYCLFIWYSGG